MEIVTIGYGPAAVKAMETLVTYQSAVNIDELKITAISAENTVAYSPMFLINYLAGKLSLPELSLRADFGRIVTMILSKQVVDVKENEAKVILEDNREINYDKLLITSGAIPIMPRINGIKKSGVYFLNRLQDICRLLKPVKNATTIIIIGSGLIGLEAAVALNNLQKKVRVIEQFDQILPGLLGKDLSKYLESRLVDKGIRFSLGQAASEVTGTKQATGIIVDNIEIKGDLVLVATGLRPNIDFLKSTALEINRGIVVDDQMQTNIPGIYAAGDVTELKDPYGEYELIFNWYRACEQGRVAGCNLMGIKKTYQYCPSLSILKGVEPIVVAIGWKRPNIVYELLDRTDLKSDTFERIFINENHIDCYQAIGLPNKIGFMYSLIQSRKNITKLKGLLLGDTINLANYTV